MIRCDGRGCLRRSIIRPSEELEDFCITCEILSHTDVRFLVCHLLGRAGLRCRYFTRVSLNGSETLLDESTSQPFGLRCGCVRSPCQAYMDRGNQGGEYAIQICHAVRLPLDHSSETVMSSRRVTTAWITKLTTVPHCQL